jgi:hypothetical protein
VAELRSATHLLGFMSYSLPSEKLDIAALRAATLILGFIWLFLWWERSKQRLHCYKMQKAYL